MSKKPKKNQKVKIEVDKKFILMLLGLPPIDVWSEKPEKGQMKLSVENYLEYLRKQKRKK